MDLDASPGLTALSPLKVHGGHEVGEQTQSDEPEIC